MEEAGAGTGLLYADTFETADGWWSRGAWSVDLRGGYTGGGWVVDGTLRGVESVLEQRQGVAVPGSGKAVLRFWQRGELSTADEVWVEVRAAGAESWSLLAALSGTDAEWSEYEIGLEAWAGYLVQLRWRVVTAGEMGAEGLEADAGAEPLAGSYWLDEVRIEQP